MRARELIFGGNGCSAPSACISYRAGSSVRGALRRSLRAVAGGTMASKVRKQQRRKRYSEAGIVFTDAYLERVEALIGGSNDAATAAAATTVSTATSAASEFKAALLAFTTLGSTYAELESLKEITEVLVKLSRGDNGGGGGRVRLSTTPLFALVFVPTRSTQAMVNRPTNHSNAFEGVS